MITIPKLTEKDLEIFKDKKIVLFGRSESINQLLTIFDYWGVSVFAIYSNNLHQLIKRRVNGIPVITINTLQRLAKKHENFIVQSASVKPDEMTVFKKAVHRLGIEFSDLPAGCILNSFTPLAYSKLLESKIGYDSQIKRWKGDYTKRTHVGLEQCLQKNICPIILCLPMKTADFTLNNTFNKINNKQSDFTLIGEKSNFQRNHFIFYKLLNKAKNIVCKKTDVLPYVNLFHKPQVINRPQLEKHFGTLKIITAVREPISQNISSLFEELVTGRIFEDWVLGDIENLDEVSRAQALEKTTQQFLMQGDDAQAMFDAFINRYIYPVDAVEKNSFRRHSIQKFTAVFKDNVLDITAYPFDQEKGYAIIKDGNTELFVYQLEKLNTLVPELSEWVGVPFDKLENGNQASDKWIAGSYKQAQKEIEITQEYFDKCFNEPYVKHCYSEADIEKFKARWRPHIKKET